jgi:hypothetical protein
MPGSLGQSIANYVNLRNNAHYLLIVCTKPILRITPVINLHIHAWFNHEEKINNSFGNNILNCLPLAKSI